MNPRIELSKSEQKFVSLIFLPKTLRIRKSNEDEKEFVSRVNPLLTDIHDRSKDAQAIVITNGDNYSQFLKEDILTTLALIKQELTKLGHKNVIAKQSLLEDFLSPESSKSTASELKQIKLNEKDSPLINKNKLSFISDDLMTHEMLLYYGIHHQLKKEFSQKLGMYDIPIRSTIYANQGTDIFYILNRDEKLKENKPLSLFPSNCSIDLCDNKTYKNIRTFTYPAIGYTFDPNYQSTLLALYETLPNTKIEDIENILTKRKETPHDEKDIREDKKRLLNIYIKKLKDCSPDLVEIMQKVEEKAKEEKDFDLLLTGVKIIYEITSFPFIDHKHNLSELNRKYPEIFSLLPGLKKKLTLEDPKLIIQEANVSLLLLTHIYQFLTFLKQLARNNSPKISDPDWKKIQELFLLLRKNEYPSYQHGNLYIIDKCLQVNNKKFLDTFKTFFQDIYSTSEFEKSFFNLSLQQDKTLRLLLLNSSCGHLVTSIKCIHYQLQSSSTNIRNKYLPKHPYFQKFFSDLTGIYLDIKKFASCQDANRSQIILSRLRKELAALIKEHEALWPSDIRYITFDDLLPTPTATQELLRELQKPSPATEKIVNSLKKGADITTMIPEKKNTAAGVILQLSSKMKLPEATEIKEAADFPKDIKPTDISWIQSQLFCYGSNNKELKEPSFKHPLDKFLYHLELNNYSHDAIRWTTSKDHGFSVYLSLAEEKRFDESISLALKRLDRIGNSLLAKISEIPNLEKSILNPKKSGFFVFSSSPQPNLEEWQTLQKICAIIFKSLIIEDDQSYLKSIQEQLKETGRNCSEKLKSFCNDLISLIKDNTLNPINVYEFKPFQVG